VGSATKLRAFDHLHLNLFEISVNEVSKPGVHGKRNASSLRYDYLGDTLSRSRIIREVLGEPASKAIWSDALHREYSRWKERRPVAWVRCVAIEINAMMVRCSQCPYLFCYRSDPQICFRSMADFGDNRGHKVCSLCFSSRFRLCIRACGGTAGSFSHYSLSSPRQGTSGGDGELSGSEQERTVECIDVH
jgi:hypothetical protein